jgi:hypothetical protein
MTEVSFDQLAHADLKVGAVYRGGTRGNAADDPLARLLPCGNQGGFRIQGRRTTHDYRLALLYTSGTDPDWPDSLDRETGVFTYYGDNKAPGAGLHETPRGGNELLRFAFDCIHADPPHRELVPPFFVFQKARSGGRDVEFLGLAVPGRSGGDAPADLVAIWRTTLGERFQNYGATFTVLDVANVRREWIEELSAGERLGPSCPEPFRAWVDAGAYAALEAPRTVEFRTVAEQTPEAADRPLIDAIYQHYSPQPHRFEACAMELWRMLAKEAVTDMTPTPPSSDGGRDAFGRYSLGPEADRIELDFSLEAKCYAPGHGAGVKETSRLISRIRHREFGVFVTTSHVGLQAYRELREDRQPVVVICGRDIVELLKRQGISTMAAIDSWLEQVDKGAAQA